MKIGLFEYNFLRQHGTLYGRIERLAGPAFQGKIFRECKICLRFQMIDLDPRKDEWNENGHLPGSMKPSWYDLVRLKYPKFTEKNFEKVICSPKCLEKWAQSEEGKKAWAEIKDRGQELPEDWEGRWRIFGWNGDKK